MALDDDIAALSSAPLFNLMSEEALRFVALAAERRALGPGDVLFTKGDRSNGGFVVTRGSIALENDKGEPVFVASPGSLVGQTALFARMTRPATARARDECAVVRISQTLMRRTLQEYPAAAEAIRAVLAAELSTVSEGLDQVRARLLAIDDENHRA